MTSNFQKHISNNPLQRFLIGNFYRSLVKIIIAIDPGSILDVGCGEGVTLALLKRKQIGRELEGIDSSREALSIGQKLYPSIILKQGDIYNLSYKDNSFDLVICTEVLEHLKRPAEALSELRRVSNKYLLLSVPNEPFFRSANFLTGKYWSRWGSSIGHIQHWSKQSFKSVVRKEGLKVLVVKAPFPWTLILGQIY